MQLKVKVIKRQEETIEVENDLVTVYDVKKIVESITAIPIKLQSLVFKGKPLADGHPLSHYSIKDGDKLFVAVKADCANERAHKGSEAESKATYTRAQIGKLDKGSITGIPVEDRVTVLPDAERKCCGPVINLPTSIPPHQRGGCWKPKTKFWEKLNTFLVRHFAPDDVDKITKIVCEEIRKSVYDINLDAVEFLANEQLKVMQ